MIRNEWWAAAVEEWCTNPACDRKALTGTAFCYRHTPRSALCPPAAASGVCTVRDKALASPGKDDGQVSPQQSSAAELAEAGPVGDTTPVTEEPVGSTIVNTAGPVDTEGPVGSTTADAATPAQISTLPFTTIAGLGTMAIWSFPSEATILEARSRGCGWILSLLGPRERGGVVKAACQHLGVPWLGVDFGEAFEDAKKGEIAAKTQLCKAFEGLHSRLTKGVKVLLHCADGLQRSAICTYVLLRRAGLQQSDAVQQLGVLRPGCLPSLDLEQLKAAEAAFKIYISTGAAWAYDGGDAEELVAQAVEARRKKADPKQVTALAKALAPFQVRSRRPSSVLPSQIPASLGPTLPRSATAEPQRRGSVGKPPWQDTGGALVAGAIPGSRKVQRRDSLSKGSSRRGSSASEGALRGAARRGVGGRSQSLAGDGRASHQPPGSQAGGGNGRKLSVEINPEAFIASPGPASPGSPAQRYKAQKQQRCATANDSFAQPYEMRLTDSAPGRLKAVSEGSNSGARAGMDPLAGMPLGESDVTQYRQRIRSTGQGGIVAIPNAVLSNSSKRRSSIPVGRLAALGRVAASGLETNAQANVTTFLSQLELQRPRTSLQ